MRKSKKVLYNFFYGLVAQIVTMVLGILIPRLLIVSYGSEVNGLLSSVRQVFVYVALLEAGIGTASLQALYKPMAENDRGRTCEIMAATDRYYRRTGLLYGGAVILLAALYPLIVPTDIPWTQVAAIILLQGASGVINYYFQGKFTILLRVDGKSYITGNASTIVSVAAKAVQIALILAGFDVVAVQAAHFVINLLQMLFITAYVRKHYAWLDLSVKPDLQALSQSRNVIIHQVSGLIFNNTDVLVLTFFCGLKTVSIYALYSLILSCVTNVIDTISSSVEFVLGQAFQSDRDRFLRLQQVYETYYFCFSFALLTVTLVMLPSFISIYSAGITDAVYTDSWLPWLFVGLNVLMYARRTSSQIINFAGHFRQTQWRSVLESVINLTVSLVLVSRIGLYGVLIGTIAALLYRTNDVILYANHRILERGAWSTYRRIGQNMALAVICAMAGARWLPAADDLLSWGITAVCAAALILALFTIVDSLCDRCVCLWVGRTLRDRARGRRSSPHSMTE